jgi:hypothetical protein
VLRLFGGCITCVPRSPDIARNPVDRLVRLGSAESPCGHVGRPSPMAGVKMSERGYGFAIVDGARPASRRMCTGLQYPKADQSG